MMKNLTLWGLALALTTVPAVANAANESVGFQGARAGVGAVRQATSSGRWIGGVRAPGGYSAYRPAVRGFILPRYWVQPNFYIGNFTRYGFSVPPRGYGWSRYYDDAVLTDRDGRVYDSVRGVDWDRDEGEDYSDSWGYRDDGDSRDEARAPDRAKDRDSGIGGAAIGGVVGAVAGNVIGGRGNRLAGTLIGGGLGAVAGAAIDVADKAGRGPKLSKRDRRLDYEDDIAYDDRGRRGGSHWDRRDDRYQGDYTRTYRRAPSYGYGWYQPTETIVTIHSAPVITTTTHVTEEITYAAAPRKRVAHKKRYWKPRPKAQCVCR